VSKFEFFILQCVKSKSVTNLAEAAADPILDQSVVELQEVRPEFVHANRPLNVDGMWNMPAAAPSGVNVIPPIYRDRESSEVGLTPSGGAACAGDSPLSP